MTAADMLSHFAPAATTATFGTVWVDARTRQCQDQTGCLQWQHADAVDLYRIEWVSQNGGRYTFVSPTALQVPVQGEITCNVPGPSCALHAGVLSTTAYPDQQGRPLGITPKINGVSVQVGDWTTNPLGTYEQIRGGVVTASCLWGRMTGRHYGEAGTYLETEMVIWGEH